MIVDLVTGYFGNELKLNEYIYNSFLWITLGSFGIAGVEKFSPQGKQDKANETEELG
jgi:hypothetical protein